MPLHDEALTEIIVACSDHESSLAILRAPSVPLRVSVVVHRVTG